jgi:thiazole/oxazole-forming peptide maturase SagD family component
VPAGACFLRYVPPTPPIVFPNETTGCASAPTREEAILRAFLEVIERDAVSLWWYNRCRRPAIPMDRLHDPLVGQAAAYLHGHGRTLWALDLTTEFGIPVAAALSATAERDAILFGFAADFDIRCALRRAVAELLQVLGPPGSWIRHCMLDAALPVDRRIWIFGATLDNQPFLCPEGTQTIADDCAGILSEPAPQLVERAIHTARACGFEILFRDLTRPETGAPAVRVFVPGLCSSWAHFAPGRLYRAPVSLGWLAEALAEEDLNPFPFFL